MRIPSSGPEMRGLYIVAMKVYTDGSCNNNEPDPKKRIVRVVVTDETGSVLVDKTLTGGSSNIAELRAVAEALAFAKSGGVPDLDVYTDSRNNLAWINGRVGKKLNDRTAVLNLIAAIMNFCETIRLTLTWIPREQNLAGHYIEHQGDPSRYRHSPIRSLDRLVIQ
jgi:ribonuclease HI